MNMSDQEDAILVRLHMRYTMVYRIPSHMAMLIVKSCVRISRQTDQYHRQIRASLTQQKEQPSSVQIPLSFHYGWFVGIPRSWVIIIPNILGSIVPYDHQPTRVLNKH